MAKVWTAYRDIDEIVRTIKKIYKEAGELPSILVKSVRESLTKSSYGMVQRFYNKLTQECPEALRYFYNEERRGEGEDK